MLFAGLVYSLLIHLLALNFLVLSGGVVLPLEDPSGRYTI